ncbi:LPS assembly lipoprotein LptE [Henriciella sp.]|uniref:LPS assembly lipoprotein LptE n=1 Tax=Henriciella sp. TaxID=1968823 RepID=UPI00262B0835|nr:LPS assembly lipoprotein LptE [Henriciella sp.]
MKHVIALLLGSLLLTACGFRPLYAGQSGLGGMTAQNISITEIDGRSGYMLRQELLRELATGLPGVESDAILTITLSEDITRASLLPDGAVSRSFYTASGRYSLETGGVVLRGDADVQVPFAATLTPYTDVSAQSYAADRAMTELSRKIVDQLRIQAQNSG